MSVGDELLKAIHRRFRDEPELGVKTPGGLHTAQADAEALRPVAILSTLGSQRERDTCGCRTITFNLQVLFDSPDPERTRAAANAFEDVFDSETIVAELQARMDAGKVTSAMMPGDTLLDVENQEDGDHWIALQVYELVVTKESGSNG